MRLLLIRHGIAVPQGTPGISDDERPLTPRGEEKFRQAAQGLARIVDPPDALLTSPLPRALRTAEIAAEAWDRVQPRKEPALAWGTVTALAQALRAYPENATIALVGHEPHLSSLLAHVLGTGHGDRLAFRKGGAALVEIADRRLDAGQLVFLLPPRVLRRLAG